MLSALLSVVFLLLMGLLYAQSWTTLEEDNIAFLLLAPKRTNCITQVLMLELSKTDT